METSLKTGFAQIFSCFFFFLSCPKFVGAAAHPAPSAHTPMEYASEIVLTSDKWNQSEFSSKKNVDISREHTWRAKR